MPIILNADDYALTEGISRAIGELAAARRLSATSVLVTSPHWPASAPRLSVHRGRLAIGLHLDLTLGPPLAPMPRLAPEGRFPTVDGLAARVLSPLADMREIRAEIERQLGRFEAGLGFPPDHIDGHQHVHVLPRVRTALLEAVAQRYIMHKPLIRYPSDRLASINARQGARTKAYLVHAASLGFVRAAHRRSLPTNDSFSGFSDFDEECSFADELERAMTLPGRRHIIMCHPGHPDAELARRDPVVARRRTEYEALLADTRLPDRIWRPSRSPDGPPIDWSNV
jgi:chitin disaccharide deacetylase